MNWQQEYKRWVTHPTMDSELKNQLETMSEKDCEEAFYTTLAFGTGGMRGILGAGTNRMNIYTIRKVSAAFAAYIDSFGDEAKKRGIVIAYDCRHFSPEFAMETARVMAGVGIKAYVFDELRPTPELSFAVRHLNAFAGVMITASHNPANYNGYKIYDETGCQLHPDEAQKVIDYVAKIDDELAIQVGSQEEFENAGLIQHVLDGVDIAYNHALLDVTYNATPTDNVVAVFTPLHGTALKPVMRILESTNTKNVHIVERQATPDPDFTTVKSPNPETLEAFELAIEKGNEVNADILLATDPDADRVGLCVRNNNGEYELLTGNQQGALIVNYIIESLKTKNELPENAVMFDTIVSSSFAKTIALANGVSVESVLTGFKFIGERINKYELTGEKTFIFGYEESYGSLVNSLARDKDAVQAVKISIEMASFYKQQNKSLLDVLVDLYDKYDYFGEKLVNIELAGKDGAEKIVKLLTIVRENPFTEAAQEKVVRFEDYATGLAYENGKEIKLTLPKSDVLKFILSSGSWFCIRPSGTEPKAKVYVGTQAKSHKEAIAKADLIEADVNKIIGMI